MFQPAGYNPPPAAPPQQRRYRPEWLESLIVSYRGRTARQFLLHFNINDFVFDMDGKRYIGDSVAERTGSAVGLSDQAPAPALTLREYLYQFLLNTFQAQVIYTYSLAGEVMIAETDTARLSVPLTQGMQTPGAQRFFQAMHDLGLDRQQTQSGGQRDPLAVAMDNLRVLDSLLRQSVTGGQGGAESRIAVILDYVEKLVPHIVEEGNGTPHQLQAMEMIQRWALDPGILMTNNINILLTINRGAVPKSLYGESSGCQAIRVPMPSDGERKAFIRFLMHSQNERFLLAPLEGFDDPTEQRIAKEEQQIAGLARATQGMRLRDIDNANRRAKINAKINAETNASTIAPNDGQRLDDQPRLTPEVIRREKAEVIQAQSQNLLEILPADRGFEEIGGLERLKNYLTDRTTRMRVGERTVLVPQGLLLAGPPGTGKTIIAEALAKVGGFNLVKMRSIRDMWVGSSERNLDLVFNLLQDLYPVVVFVDEVDQALGRRDTGQNLDSGVSARMFGRVLEVMSDQRNRGRILWVAATNRADALDAAMLRRFDRVIPLLVPNKAESCMIFAVMPAMIGVQGGRAAQDVQDAQDAQDGNAGDVAYGGDFRQGGQPNGQLDPNRFLFLAELTTQQGMTGSGIEVVVRRAIEMAYEDSARPPRITARMLKAAFDDYKPNQNRDMYDLQGLLAIQACNFNSVMPEIPNEGVYARIKDRTGRIDPVQLQTEIDKLKAKLRIQ